MLRPEGRSRRFGVRAPAVAGLFVGAAVVHGLLSRGHVTPFVFPDELPYEKLAQSFADASPFVVRGHSYWFSTPLASVVTAPAWLLGTVPHAIAAAQALNAVAMAAAVFPVHRIARRIGLGERGALTAAAGAVAVPGMAYHSFLLSEAVAFPVFFLALAALLAAVAEPTPRRLALFVGAVLLALSARLQFAVLPLAYAASVALVPLLRREPWLPSVRRHAPALGAFAALGVLALVYPHAYSGDYYDWATPSVPYTLVDDVRWGLRTAAYLPWGIGWIALPGAAGGLWALGRRARSRDEAAFAVATLALVVLIVLEIGAVRAGDRHHPAVERYAIYLTPLALLALLAAAARAVEARVVVAAAAVVLAGLAWVLAFPTAPPYEYRFDSTTQTAYADAAQRLQAHSGWLAAHLHVLCSAAATSALLVVGLLALRRRGHVAVFALTVAFLLASLAAYTELDHAATRNYAAAWTPPERNWVDALGVGDVLYLELPGAYTQLGREAEAWNRSIRRVADLRTLRPPNDRMPIDEAHIDANGRLLVDSGPLAGGTVLVNDYGSRLDLGGTALTSPQPGLRLVRVPPAPRVRLLVTGLYADGWSARSLRAEAWRRGAFSLTVSLPRGFAARTVRVTCGGATRTARLAAGASRRLVVPAAGPHPVLRLRVDRTDLRDLELHPRRVGVRVAGLRFGS